MALQAFELFGYASNKTSHEDAIAAKIADGWTFHPPVTISTEGEDCKLCATFTKDVAMESIGRRKRKRR